MDVYHAQCVDLFPMDVMSFKRNCNIVWLCESCGKQMRQIRNDKMLPSKQVEYAAPEMLSPQPSMETDMKEEIRELKEQVQAIQRSVANLSLSRASSEQEEIPLARSPPKCELLHGSKLQVNSKHPSPSREKFWLFFTRIRNTVSENQVFQMVSKVIGSQDIIVKRLVAGWKDVSLLPFISYKIGIDIRYKEVAMSPSNWPKGICYREFYEDYQLWEP